MVRRRGGCRWGCNRPVGAAESGGSGSFLRCARLDGQRVNALGDHPAQGIIHEAMAGNSAQSGHAISDDSHPQMRAFAGPGMAGVQVAVVDHFQRLQRAQGLAQDAVDFGGGDVRHGGGDQAGGLPSRAVAPPGGADAASGVSSMYLLRYRPCASVNSSISPTPPKSLKLTQVSVLKL